MDKVIVIIAFTFLLACIVGLLKVMIQKEACNKCPLKNKCRYMEGTTGYNVCDNYNMIYGNHRL